MICNEPPAVTNEPIFSPDGQHMWTGSEWIPAPPSTGSVNVADSVVMGDVVQNFGTTNDEPCPACSATKTSVLSCQSGNCTNQWCSACGPMDSGMCPPFRETDEFLKTEMPKLGLHIIEISDVRMELTQIGGYQRLSMHRAHFWGLLSWIPPESRAEALSLLPRFSPTEPEAFFGYRTSDRPTGRMYDQFKQFIVNAYAENRSRKGAIGKFLSNSGSKVTQTTHYLNYYMQDGERFGRLVQNARYIQSKKLEILGMADRAISNKEYAAHGGKNSPTQFQLEQLEKLRKECTKIERDIASLNINALIVNLQKSENIELLERDLIKLLMDKFQEN